MGTKCSVTKTFRRLIILRPQYSSPQNLCLVGQDDLEEDARDFFENLEAARSFLGLSALRITENCKKRGNIADVDNCGIYVSCRGKNWGMVKTCRNGYKFDSITLKCRSGDKATCLRKSG